MVQHLTAHGLIYVQHRVCVAHDRWACLRSHPALRVSGVVQEVWPVGHGLIIWLWVVRVHRLRSAVLPDRSPGSYVR
jgi:hypothetical protein